MTGKKATVKPSVSRFVVPKRKSTNRLTHAKVAALYDYLRDNQAEVESSTLSLYQLTTQISDKLGFSVNTTTVEQALRDRGIKRRRNADEQLEIAIAELEKQFTNVKALLQAKRKTK